MVFMHNQQKYKLHFLHFIPIEEMMDDLDLTHKQISGETEAEISFSTVNMSFISKNKLFDFYNGSQKIVVQMPIQTYRDCILAMKQQYIDIYNQSTKK